MIEKRFWNDFVKQVADRAMYRDEQLIEEYILRKKRRVLALAWKLAVDWMTVVCSMMHLVFAILSTCMDFALLIFQFLPFFVIVVFFFTISISAFFFSAELFYYAQHLCILQQTGKTTVEIPKIFLDNIGLAHLFRDNCQKASVINFFLYAIRNIIDDIKWHLFTQS